MTNMRNLIDRRYPRFSNTKMLSWMASATSVLTHLGGWTGSNGS